MIVPGVSVYLFTSKHTATRPQHAGPLTLELIFNLLLHINVHCTKLPSTWSSVVNNHLSLWLSDTMDVAHISRIMARFLRGLWRYRDYIVIFLTPLLLLPLPLVIPTPVRAKCHFYVIYVLTSGNISPEFSSDKILEISKVALELHMTEAWNVAG